MKILVFTGIFQVLTKISKLYEKETYIQKSANTSLLELFQRFQKSLYFSSKGNDW